MKGREGKGREGNGREGKGKESYCITTNIKHRQDLPPGKLHL